MVKQRSFLFLALAVYWCACKKERPLATDVKDTNYQKAVAFLDHHRNDSAYYYFNKTVSSTKDSLQIARAYNNMAVIQYGVGDYYGAQEMLTLSLKCLDDQNDLHYRCLSSDYDELGLTNMKLKNFEAALPLFDLAIKYASSDDTRRIFLNNKALTLERKGDFTEALKLYQAILSQKIKSRKEFARTVTNMAMTNWLVHPGYNAAPAPF